MIIPTKEWLEIFKNTNGALSVTEAIAIMNITKEAPNGYWLEMGSFRGKSAMSALFGGDCVEFRLIDPLFEKEVPTKEVCDSITEAIGRAVRMMFVPGYSTDFLENSTYEYSYVFSDSGTHDGGLPLREVKLLEDRVVPGGIICFHDFGNQFREPKEAAEYLVSTGKYDWMNIDWDEIKKYVVENNLEEGNNSWHIYDDVPQPHFVGAVKRK